MNWYLYLILYSVFSCGVYGQYDENYDFDEDSDGNPVTPGSNPPGSSPAGSNSAGINPVTSGPTVENFVAGPSVEKLGLGIETYLYANLLRTQPKQNLVLSPLSIWSILLLIYEGSGGETRKQLQDALRLPRNVDELRLEYSKVSYFLHLNNTVVETTTGQAIFNDVNRPLENEYEFITSYMYNAELQPLDFANERRAKQALTTTVKRLTNGRIVPNLQSLGISDTQVLLMSGMYFAGKWQVQSEYRN